VDRIVLLSDRPALDVLAALEALVLDVKPVDLSVASVADAGSITAGAIVVDAGENPGQGFAVLRALEEQRPERPVVAVVERRDLDRFAWDTVADELLALLDDATRIRLRADVPVGAYLSGGLDSSIVLACLEDAPSQPRITCFHYYPLGADLDERAYARAAAAKAGLPLLERARDSAFSLQPLLAIHRMPEPTNYSYFLEHSRLEAQLAAEQGAAAVVIGYGGDQLFYQERAEWAPGDFLHRRGLRPGVLRVALDAAQMDQISVWHVLGEALSSYFAHQRWSVLQEAGRKRPLLKSSVIKEARRDAGFLHPLLRHPRGAPSGKLWHAHQMSQPFDFYDPLQQQGDAERMSPLCSQPLMELCLRIPTYVLTHGGWDRAVARRAFYDDLPPEIRNRRHKGGIEEHLRLTLEHNRPFLRELLLDGALVREGIIDRASLAEVLSGRATPIAAGSGEVLEYAGIEAWLGRWRGM